MKNSAPSPGLRARLVETVRVLRFLFPSPLLTPCSLPQVTTAMLGNKVFPVLQDATDLAATPVSMERRVRRAQRVCQDTTA